MLEGFLTVTPWLRLRFSRWDEIQKQPEPDSKLFGINAIWHFTRGMAYASNAQIARAESERDAFLSWVKKTPVDAPFGLNPAPKVMSIAEEVLNARIASAKGDDKMTIEALRKAVDVEDSLAYDEPPTWFLPVREMLGGALLKQANFPAAEQVFRDDLLRNRRNGRSLFGLLESLKAQQKDYAAAMIRREFESAWKNADAKLTIQDLWP